MNTLRSIVVGVDFSTCSGSALRQAGRIAQWNRSGVTAVAVVEPLMYDVGAPIGMIPVPSAADQIEDANYRWSRFTPDAPSRSAMLFQTLVGYPTGEIVHFARETKADLVVMGAHSVLDAARGVGAIAAGVARNAHCSVLLVRQEQAGAFRSIVVAVDFSESSRDALEQAVRLAAQDGTSLAVVHTYRDPWANIPDVEEASRNMPGFREKYLAAVGRRVQEFAAPLHHELLALKATYHGVQHDSPARGIIQFVKDRNADLVVLGSRGHSRLRELLFGTTAERVVREAHTSVLIVRK